jgi:glycosyltransferase involved in cell wall biosynthesis
VTDGSTVPDDARLCLNMIVRNESAILERCLRSVADHIACWVIGDTGSTDGTRDLIRAFFAERGIPGELHEFPFVDFEQARNEALTRARASPLGFDYLLLTDADMELVVRDRGFRRGLSAECYMLLQNAGISYYNNRLVRRDADARYVGVTHEYLRVVGRTERLETAWFIDHANGSNRREKYERDLRLLTGALERDPDNARTVFYIAQTYRDAGQHAEAIPYFDRRAGMPGYEEEAWYARWQQARSYLKIEDEAAFLRTALIAWNTRPQRAEPLFDLARFWRDRKQYDVACTFAELGLATPWPERDILFVDDYIYAAGLASEYAIAGYYARQPKHRDRGRELCDWLAMRRDIPLDTRNNARANAFYYVRPAAATMPSIRFQPFAPAGFVPADLRAPSLAMRRGELGLLVSVAPREGIAASGLVLFRLGADLRPLGHHALPPPPEGVGERAQLLARDRAFWTLLGGGEGGGEAAFVLAPAEAAATGDPIPLRLAAETVVQDHGSGPRFLTGYGPARIVDAAGAVAAERFAPFTCDTFRPASPAIAFDGGWLALVRESAQHEGKPRIVHRFLWLDADATPARTSFRFDLRQAGSERVTGLVWHPDRKRLVIAASDEAGAPLLATVDAAEVRAALRPFAGEYRHGRNGLRRPAAITAGPSGRLGQSTRRTAVLFRTHEWTDPIRDGFRRLVRETPQADVCVVAYIAPQQRVPEAGTDTAFFIGASDLTALPYPGKLRGFNAARPGGGNDLPVMWFWRNFPGYDRYWVVEYDVHYTGKWGALFADLDESPADLLATAVMDQDENPRWGWWPAFTPGDFDVPKHRMTKCFPPFCRLSSRALAAIDDAYVAGLAGHYEITWATICRLRDLLIEEIGGDGRYTPRARRNRYYTMTPTHWTLFPGTFVYRPGFRPEDVHKLGASYDGADLLWHPVKP